VKWNYSGSWRIIEKHLLTCLVDAGPPFGVELVFGHVVCIGVIWVALTIHFYYVY